MKAFEDSEGNLILQVTIETPDDLLELTDLDDLVRIHFPRLEKINPVDIKANTNAPIYRFRKTFWHFPDYQTVDAMETLRDTHTLTLIKV